MTLRLIIADDHEVTLVGLLDMFSRQPDMEVVGTATDGIQALKLALNLRPDVVLLDLLMPGLKGMEVTANLLTQWPEAKVVVFTTYSYFIDVRETLLAGAKAYLLKDSEPTVILECVRNVAAGKRHYSPAVADRMADIIAKPELDKLKQRETEVLQLIAEGLSNSDIADHLNVQPTTIKAHVNGLIAKFSAKDRLGAIHAAIQFGHLKVGRLPGLP